MTAPTDRCSLRSEASREPLAGTASTIRHWLLIEHAGPWGRDGLLDARLPEGLGGRLRALGRRARARVALIRRSDRDQGTGVVCFAVDTADAWLGRTAIDTIEDAASLDPRRAADFRIVTDPLALICTHGRRDPCCAERGRPLAQTTAAAFPDLTWESTHVGGDRFAANLVAFPHGLYFGHLRPPEGPEIVRAYSDGLIRPLHRYRGRSSHATYVQSAEGALRNQLGLDRLDDVQLLGAERRGDVAAVTFATPKVPFRVRLEQIAGEPMRLTCHSEREEAPQLWRPLEIAPRPS